MSKAVLISIRPEWCDKIASGRKTMELRKTRPKLDTPFKCYIYCTLKGSKEYFHDIAEEFGQYEAQVKWYRERWYDRKGKVIGEFVCDWISTIELTDEGYNFDCPKMTGLSYEAMADYLNGKTGFGWHISGLKIYDTPKELEDFWRERFCQKERIKDDCVGCWDCSTRPPQSWCYVEEVGDTENA